METNLFNNKLLNLNSLSIKQIISNLWFFWLHHDILGGFSYQTTTFRSGQRSFFLPFPSNSTLRGEPCWAQLSCNSFSSVHFGKDQNISSGRLPLFGGWMVFPMSLKAGLDNFLMIPKQSICDIFTYIYIVRTILAHMWPKFSSILFMDGMVFITFTSNVYRWDMFWVDASRLTKLHRIYTWWN